MKAYRFLAITIAVLIVVQAGAIAWGFFGVTNFVTDGGVIDEEFLDCTEDCESIGSAECGFAIHMFFNGLILIPLCSLVLLIVSFFAKIPQGHHAGRDHLRPGDPAGLRAARALSRGRLRLRRAARDQRAGDDGHRDHGRATRLGGRSVRPSQPPRPPDG